MNKAAKGRYADVNGLKMYYEIHGTGGTPLILLHGVLTTIDSSFGHVLPSLAKSRQVIAIELQGHGHTADIDRPWTEAQMAEDTAALLGQLKIEKADFFGWSMGGNVALAIAIRHPDLVHKVISIGAHHGTMEEACGPEQAKGFRTLPADFAPKEFKDPYDKVAPDPKQWPVMVAKMKKMALESKGFPKKDVQSIKAPFLVMIGDREEVRLEHVVELFRLLPNGQLAVFPSTDHFMLWQHPDWVLSMITSFLDAPMPKAT